MSDTPKAAYRALDQYLDRLRRRAFLRDALVILLLASAAFVAAVLIAAASAGPIVSPTAAATAWALCALPPLAVLGIWLRRRRRHLGPHAARLLQTHAPDLALPLQTAVELGKRRLAGGGHSQELAQAHAAQVARRIEGLPPTAVLPMSDLRRPSLGLALLVCALGALAIGATPQLRGGLLSLSQPARVARDGMLTAPIADQVEARLIFPSYLRKPPEAVPNPEVIRAPVGSTLELSLRARVPAQEVLLVLGEQRTRLSLEAGCHVGRVVVREDSTLEVQMRSAGQWYRDATSRKVIAEADQAPLVEILSPADGSWVDAEETAVVAFRARDDEGLAELDLHLKLPDGRQLHRRIWSSVGSADAPTRLSERTGFVPAEFGIAQGDRFELWLQARDGDAVAGPNLGESQHITLEALSHAQHLSQHLPMLKRVMDLGLVSLAERLERPLSPDPQEARQRHEALTTAEETWLTALDELTGSLEEENTDSLGLDREQLGAIGNRYRRAMAREAQLHRRRVDPLSARTRADTELVGEAEKDVLLLADLLAQAHLDEANALAEELKGLKGRIQELLKALAESDNAEAKRELLAEIARAERRLKELMRSMASLAANVPSEFVNRDALEPAGAGQAMDELRTSVQEGDLDAAAKHLEALEQQLDALASGLESGGLQFRKSRFGPRDEAMMKAREQLAMLSDEQQALAQASADQTREIMGRGNQASPQPRTDDLQRTADDLAKQLEQLGEAPLGMSEQRVQEQAQARLDDTRAALRTGDLSEAQRMAAASQRAMERLARNMETNARMFQGHDGKAGERAEMARAASDGMAGLQEAIDRRTPQLDRKLTGEDARNLEQLAERQRQARKAADQLRDTLQNGPEGLPLSPEGARAMERAEDVMREAEERLQDADLQDATVAQEQAAEELQQLSEKLAQKQSGSGSGGGQRRPGSDGATDADGRVRIPDAEDFEAPTARRRRLLDAMREGRPPGYGGAVEAYYRELLR